MKQQFIANSKIIVLAILLSLGISSALAYSAWVGPTASPTSNNADTPLNVGNNTQDKLGRLRINTNPNLATLDKYGLDVYGISRFFGLMEIGTSTATTTVKIVDGNQAYGSVLMSDANGMARWVATSSLGLSNTTTITTPLNTRKYYFGGFYNQYGFTNPLAGDVAGCPDGYRVYTVWGLADVDRAIYLCVGSSDEVQPVGHFGGMYGYAASSYNNPITGAKSCPSGFTAKQIAFNTGSGPTDKDVQYCYNDTTATASAAEPFGGVWGNSAGNHLNPISGTKACPGGYNQQQVAGLNNVDWGLYFCYGGTEQYPEQY